MKTLDIAVKAGHRLAELVTDSGRFLYRHDSANGSRFKGYNLLRHCGCIWALNEIAPYSLDAGPKQAALRALGWLVRNKIERADDGSYKVFQRDSVKLGGNALALLAFIGSGVRTVETECMILGLAQYIIKERLSSGEFIDKRARSTGEIRNFQSDYYTGQALFALIRVHDFFQGRGIVDIVEDSIRKLWQSQYGVTEQNHWLAYAIEALYRYEPSLFLIQYIEYIVGDIIQNPQYRSTGRSTPIACRSEALLCLLRMQRNGAPIREEILRTALQSLRQNLQLQCESFLPDGSFVAGTDNTEVRIDYIQHNLMTFLEYSKIFEGALPRPPKEVPNLA